MICTNASSLPTMAIACLAVASSACGAEQTAAPAPATPPAAAVKADPLAGFITPAQWLGRQPKPKFKPGHTLPPLTRYGWCLGFESQKEFAEHWGYCVQPEPYTNLAWVDRYLNPSPKDEAAVLPSQLVALAKSDPKKYRLAVVTSRELPPYDKAPRETFARDAEGHLLTEQATSQDGTAWTPGAAVVLSPLTPDSFWAESGRLQAAPLKRLNDSVPITIILNGAEYGLHLWGQSAKVWWKDPAITKAMEGKKPAKWAGERVARSQKLIADEIRKAVPKAEYLYYGAGGAGSRGQYGWWDDWATHFEDIRDVYTLPGPQMYYKDFNDGWMANPTASIPADALTIFLNARGQEIAGGQPLQYPWLCAGYKQLNVGPDVSDIPRYMGFLRCAFTAGVIGGNAGYYNYPDFNTAKPEDGPGRHFSSRRGFDAVFPPEEPPHWLEQMVALSRVQAQFSFLEDYLRQGELLPGSYQHVYSCDQPAYELVPAGMEPDSGKTMKVPLMPPDDQAVAGWEKAGFADAAWKGMAWAQLWDAVAADMAGNQFDGVVAFRKTVEIPATLAGKDIVLNLGTIDDRDTTYWNGEKVGESNDAGVKRLYKIPGAKVKAGLATIAVRVFDGKGQGGFSGKPDDHGLMAADGTQSVPLTGEWKWRVLAKQEQAEVLGPVGRPVRVLARKLRDKPRWLITAWAADGENREVRVTVPELGEVTLEATAEANVYEATLQDRKAVLKVAGT